MASNFPENLSPNKRENHIWVADLSGDNGTDAQNSAHRDLNIYLYTVVHRYLKKRGASVGVLKSFTADELGELAEDFVQDTLEKITEDNYELLHKYESRGAFTSWMAQIATNIAASELRRPYWVRRERSGRNSSQDYIDEDNNLLSIERYTVKNRGALKAETQPEEYTVQQEVGRAIQECSESLSKRYRKVFVQIIVNENPVEDIAMELEISTNAVYVLVTRVKRKMRQCLTQKGIIPPK